ncbi:MAG: transposase [Bdellovibrionota bacterium]
MTKRRSQADLFPQILKEARAGFGGACTARSNPTSRRPFARRTPMHLVLRSDLAKGSRSLLLKDSEIRNILAQESARVGAKALDLANVGNHLHLVMTFPSAVAMSHFLRAFSGRVARAVLDAKKGRGRLSMGTRFWAGRPFSRIVGWGGPLKTLTRYVQINRQESLGQKRGSARKLLSQLEELGLVCFGARSFQSSA